MYKELPFLKAGTTLAIRIEGKTPLVNKGGGDDLSHVILFSII